MMTMKVMFLLGAILASFVLQTSSQECGTSPFDDAGECDREGADCSPNPGRQIVGGIEARLHELPYQVSLLYNGGFFCGGILLDDQHVLTAAHCTAGDPAEDHSIVLGEHVRSEDNDNKLEVGCSQIIEHEDYNAFTLENDIAIMTMSESVEAHFSRVPICYDAANGGDNVFGEACVMSGWGGEQSGGSVTDELRYAEGVVLDFDTCAACDGFSPGEITPGMLCVGVCGDNTEDTCQGDSGGPVAVKSDGLFYGVGITSWGHGCSADTPGVYTDIAYYEDWIRANLP